MQRKMLLTGVTMLAMLAVPAVAETVAVPNVPAAPINQVDNQTEDASKPSFVTRIGQAQGVVRHIGDKIEIKTSGAAQKNVESALPVSPAVTVPVVAPVVAASVHDLMPTSAPAAAAKPVEKKVADSVKAPVLHKVEPKAQVKQAAAKSVHPKIATKKGSGKMLAKNAKSSVTKHAAKANKTPGIKTVAVATAKAATAVPQILSANPVAGNIMEVAQSAGNFKTMTHLLRLAGLKPMLETQGKYTLFAPNDGAFSRMSAAQLANLEQPDNREQLVQILSNHIIGGQRLTDTAIHNMIISPATMAGQPLTFSSADGKTLVNEANIVGKSIPCSNGVIHVVDQVLLPAPMIATSPAGVASAPQIAPQIETARNNFKAGEQPETLRDMLERNGR